MKKKHKIVVIPRTPFKKEVEIGDICRSRVSGKFGLIRDVGFSIPSLTYNVEDLLIDCTPIFQLKWKYCTQQQLLLLSDEEIKEGDFVCHRNIEIFKARPDDFGNNRNYIKKVIAVYPQIESLPTFSKDFIQEWVNNPVEEVEVECSKFTNDLRSGMFIYSPVLKNNEVICNIILTQEKMEDLLFELSGVERNKDLNNIDQQEVCCDNIFVDNQSPSEELNEIKNCDDDIFPFDKELESIHLGYCKENFYTEEEVKKLIFECWNKAYRLGMKESSPIIGSREINVNTWKEWFDKHKKK